MTEKVLPYDRSIVPQETGYFCGPASTQVILNSRGVIESEQALAEQMGTTWNGTNHVGLIAPVLNKYIGGDYKPVFLERDPISATQKDRLWTDIVRSIDAGFGVSANIDAPPNNYPRGVKGSVSPAYGGGEVLHYIAIMGYDDVERAVWIADSGFRPFGYWCSFDQLATLLPPKGYAAATVAPAPKLSLADIELTKKFPSRSRYCASDEPVDTLAGFILNIDARVHEWSVER